jgi:hypothetical protein
MVDVNAKGYRVLLFFFLLSIMSVWLDEHLQLMQSLPDLPIRPRPRKFAGGWIDSLLRGFGNLRFFLQSRMRAIKNINTRDFQYSCLDLLHPWQICRNTLSDISDT